jgi:hypothetical protein
MAHPKNGQQPDHMSHYDNTAQDNGGVHTNSGIMNNAAYLFANGGTNDTSGKAVSGLGTEKAEKIYFRASTTCYTSSTNFAQAANCNVEAAKNIYGADSCEAITVKNAFIATGIVSGTVATCGTSCTPVCSGKTCGSGDGCGGTCQPGSGCNSTCTSACSGKACGADDGCGGTCQPGSGCDSTCTPACSGKACGSEDGCGGTCQAGSGCTSTSGSEAEPNNDRGSATALELDKPLTGAVNPTRDNDWFRASVPKGSYVHVHVGDLTDDCDIRLYSSGGTLLSVSQNGGTTDEDIAGTVKNSVYYLKVFAYQGKTCNYTITLPNK